MSAKSFQQVFLVMFLLASVPFASAVIDHGSIKVFAVTDSGAALEATLTIAVEPGTGKIWSSVGPLIGTSTQNTEKISLEVARNYFDRTDEYDYKFDINSNATIVEGPSAGAAMSLLLISMLQGKPLPEYVSVTGSINEDATVGGVGGVFEKSRRAAESGITLFMIPMGEAVQTHKFEEGVKTINLVNYAWNEWGLKVIEVDNVDDMLHYAFMDFNAIDVNEISQVQPEVFEPSEIPLGSKLAEMRILAEQYLRQAENEIEEAKIAFNETEIRDPSVIATLLALLTPAEKELENSAVLLEKNYLYSSANSSFISYINAKLVKDISQNPSLLRLDSFLLEQKALELRKRIEEVESELDSVTFVEKAEWQIGAQERLTWAKVNIETILASRTIVVGGSEELSRAIQNVQDFEYAEGWTGIASDFLEISKKSQTRTKPFRGMEDTALDYLVKAEDSAAVIPEDESYDIKRRIDAAKVEKAFEWYAASAFDSASAFALATAKQFTGEKNLNELQSELSSKISEVKKEMRNSGREFLWAQLYLDHSEYFLKASRYYEDKNKKSKAADNARDGLNLAFMAAEIFKVSNETLAEIESSAIVPVIVTPSPKESVSPSPTPFTLDLYSTAKIAMPFVLLALIVVIILLIFLYQRRPVSKWEPSSAEKAAELEKLRKKLDRAFERDRISGKEYREVLSKYEGKMKKLEEERRRKSQHLIHLDILQGELKLLQYSLKKLHRQYDHGEIFEEDYRRTMNMLGERIEKTKNQIIEAQKSPAPVEKNGKSIPRRRLSAKRKASKAIEKRLGSKPKKKRGKGKK